MTRCVLLFHYSWFMYWNSLISLDVTEFFIQLLLRAIHALPNYFISFNIKLVKLVSFRRIIVTSKQPMRLIKPLEKNIKHPIHKIIYGSKIQKLGNSISTCVSKFKRTHMENKTQKINSWLWNKYKDGVFIFHYIQTTCYIYITKYKRLKDHNFCLFLFFGRENRVLWPWNRVVIWASYRGKTTGTAAKPARAQWKQQHPTVSSPPTGGCGSYDVVPRATWRKASPAP